jgi:hypothetical protein
MIPDLVLERHRLGELTEEERSHLEELARTDAQLRERMLALVRSDEETAADCSWPQMARAVVDRANALERAPRLSPRLRWGLAAAGAVMLIVIVQPQRWVGAPEGDDERSKGSQASLMIFRQTAGGSELLQDNDAARPGDVVRVGYRLSEPRYGAIISVDGRGVVTVHLPADGTEASLLTEGDRVLLDNAFELDDAPVVERFYLILASKPFRVEPIVDHLRHVAAPAPSVLDLSSMFTVTTLALRKDARP